MPLDFVGFQGVSEVLGLPPRQGISHSCIVHGVSTT